MYVERYVEDSKKSFTSTKLHQLLNCLTHCIVEHAVFSQNMQNIGNMKNMYFS